MNAVFFSLKIIKININSNSTMLRAAIPEELSLSQPLALLQQLASLAENMGGSSGGEQKA